MSSFYNLGSQASQDRLTGKENVFTKEPQVPSTALSSWSGKLNGNCDRPTTWFVKSATREPPAFVLFADRPAPKHLLDQAKSLGFPTAEALGVPFITNGIFQSLLRAKLRQKEELEPPKPRPLSVLEQLQPSQQPSQSQAALPGSQQSWAKRFPGQMAEAVKIKKTSTSELHRKRAMYTSHAVDHAQPAESRKEYGLQATAHVEKVDKHLQGPVDTYVQGPAAKKTRCVSASTAASILSTFKHAKNTQHIPTSFYSPIRPSEDGHGKLFSIFTDNMPPKRPPLIPGTTVTRPKKASSSVGRKSNKGDGRRSNSQIESSSLVAAGKSSNNSNSSKRSKTIHTLTSRSGAAPKLAGEYFPRKAYAKQPYYGFPTSTTTTGATATGASASVRGSNIVDHSFIDNNLFDDMLLTIGARSPVATTTAAAVGTAAERPRRALPLLTLGDDLDSINAITAPATAPGLSHCAMTIGDAAPATNVTVTSGTSGPTTTLADRVKSYLTDAVSSAVSLEAMMLLDDDALSMLDNPSATKPTVTSSSGPLVPHLIPHPVPHLLPHPVPHGVASTKEGTTEAFDAVPQLVPHLFPHLLTSTKEGPTETSAAAAAAAAVPSFETLLDGNMSDVHHMMALSVLEDPLGRDTASSPIASTDSFGSLDEDEYDKLFLPLNCESAASQHLSFAPNHSSDTISSAAGQVLEAAADYTADATATADAATTTVSADPLGLEKRTFGLRIHPFSRHSSQPLPLALGPRLFTAGQLHAIEDAATTTAAAAAAAEAATKTTAATTAVVSRRSSSQSTATYMV